jgi:predicted transcriptional regulator
MLSHMRTTIEIADDLMIRAKETARREKKTLRALLEEILREALAARPKRRASFRAGEGSFQGTGLRPGIDPKDVIELSYPEWKP